MCFICVFKIDYFFLKGRKDWSGLGIIIVIIKRCRKWSVDMKNVVFFLVEIKL